MNWEKYISDLKKTSTPRLILYGVIVLIILFLLFFKGKKQQGEGDNSGSGTDTQPTESMNNVTPPTGVDLSKMPLPDIFNLIDKDFILLDAETSFLESAKEEYEAFFGIIRSYFGGYTIKKKHVVVPDAGGRNRKLLKIFRSAFHEKDGLVFSFVNVNINNVSSLKLVPLNHSDLKIKIFDENNLKLFKFSDYYSFSINRNIAFDVLNWGGKNVVCFFHAPTELPTVDNSVGEFTFFCAVIFKDEHTAKLFIEDLGGALMHKMEK